MSTDDQPSTDWARSGRRSRRNVCPDCDGFGEMWVGDYEIDTGAYVTVTCATCEGSGRP